MKRSFLLTFSLFILSISAFSQIRVGITGSLSFGNIHQNFENEMFEFDALYRIAYDFGILTNYELINNLSIESGIIYSVKGFKRDVEFVTYEEEIDDVKNKVHYNYLMVPIIGVLKYHGLLLKAGPYVALGIGGKNKWNYKITHDGEVQEINDEINLIPKISKVTRDELKTTEQAYYLIDYGLTMGLGYQLKDIAVSFNYSLGLGNMQADFKENPDTRKNNAFYNRSFGVSVCYFLLGSKE